MDESIAGWGDSLHGAHKWEHFLEGLPYFHLIKGIPLRSERWISDRKT